MLGFIILFICLPSFFFAYFILFFFSCFPFTLYACNYSINLCVCVCFCFIYFFLFIMSKDLIGLIASHLNSFVDFIYIYLFVCVCRCLYLLPSISCSMNSSILILFFLLIVVVVVGGGGGGVDFLKCLWCCMFLARFTTFTIYYNEMARVLWVCLCVCI